MLEISEVLTSFSPCRNILFPLRRLTNTGILKAISLKLLEIGNDIYYSVQRKHCLKEGTRLLKATKQYVHIAKEVIET